MLSRRLLTANSSCVIASAIRLYYVTQFFAVSLQVHPKQFEGTSSSYIICRNQGSEENRNRGQP